MSFWVHINAWFHKDDGIKEIILSSGLPQNKPEGKYRQLILFFKQIVEELLMQSLVNRYFYLFEPNPDAFLAVELRDASHLDFITSVLNNIEKPQFINSLKLKINSDDHTNGEAALDFLYAGTKYAFFRIGPDYEPKYENNDECKMVHCFCNQLFVGHDKEKLFYMHCLEYRGARFEMKDGKIIISLS